MMSEPEPMPRVIVACDHCAGDETITFERTRCDHGRRIVKIHRSR